MTEFVIVMPLFVAMIYGSLYLAELGVLRLKAQEIARYTAWSMAVRPLSNFADFDHAQAIADAQLSAQDELAEIYSDLDAARDDAARPALAVAGAYDAPTSADLQVRQVKLLPGGLDVLWPGGSMVVSLLLSALNLGAGTQDLFAGPFATIGLNTLGEVHGRARVRALPPGSTQDAARATALAEQGRLVGADLSAWQPTGAPIQDNAQPIEVALIVDPWRLQEGETAHPATPGTFGNVVAKVSEDAIKALPAGPLLNWLLGLVIEIELPSGLSQVFGVPPNNPKAHLFARPYTAPRGARPAFDGEPEPGQADIFTETGSDAQEAGAVRVFDTLPMYRDASGASPLLDALNRRGPGFLGCPREQERRCAW